MRETPTVMEETFTQIPLEPEGWRMAGQGGFHFMEGEAESDGGPGILWHTGEELADFILKVDWRIHDRNANSGIFLRIPALGSGNPDKDWLPAVDLGFEVQIDDRGRDADTGRGHDSFQMTGAIYRLAPAELFASRPVGEWNTFEIEARFREITVWLNGERISHYNDREATRQLRGHLGLQNHHAGSRVSFRNLRVQKLE